MTTDLQRIRYVTENFAFLQGLRSLPLGLLFLLFAAGMAGWNLFVPAQVGFLEGVIILACFGASWWIGTLYKRRFGRVERKRSRAWDYVIVIAATVIAVEIDLYASLPVDLLSLTLSGFFIWMYVDWKERIHYLVIGTVLVGVCLAPLLPSAGFDGRLWGEGGAAFIAAMCLGLIIGGLLDHRLLVRTLPPAPEENLDQPNPSTDS